MPNAHLPVASALALILTLTSACNPEAVVIPPPRDASAGGTGTTVGNATGATGGAEGLDAGSAGGSPSPYTDAGKSDVDAAAADAGTGTVVVVDGAMVDAASEVDAGRDAGADGAVPCTINDPRFGCGTRLSIDWIHFASGLDIDTKYGRAWSPVIAASSFQGVRSACAALEVDRIVNFEAPEVDDVRTLAAGCAATVPGGSCAVQSGVVLPSQAGSCSCDTGVGPNQGKFCRTEVPDCETLWTATECGLVNAECPTPRSWFYDVRNGALVLSEPGQPIASGARARCVAAINYRAP